LRVLAIDDEPPALDELVYLLGQNAAIGEVSAAGDVTEALRLLHLDRFDAVLLDIRMPGLDGMELARLLRRFAHPPAVVFVTADSQHAVEAFEVHAVDYLVKPLRRERLDDAINKVLADLADKPAERQPNQNTAEATELIAARPGPPSSLRSDVVPVEVGNRVVLVPRDQVSYVEASGDYVRLYTDEGSYLLRAAIGALEVEWAELGYLRIHRRYLVAIHRVRELRTERDGAYRVVVGQVELPVSRRHAREVRERFVRTGRSRNGNKP
jgi:two-component system, LytTR family, response regulator LytT